MKYLILVLTMSFYFGNTNAQDIPASDVPEVVKNAFMNAYPSAKDIEWERKGENYNVEFEIGKNDHELWITSSGKIVKHKEDISSSDLPIAINNKIKKEYIGYRIDDMEKLTIGKKVLYKVELEKGGGNTKGEIDLVFDQNAKSYEKIEWYESYN